MPRKRTCQYQVRKGPNKLMTWGVWDPPVYDGLIAHGQDDQQQTIAPTGALATVANNAWRRTQ